MFLLQVWRKKEEYIFRWTFLRLVTFYVYSSDIWETYIHSCTKAPPISVFAWLTKLYFITQYVGVRTIHTRSAPVTVFALQTYDLGSYLSRLCIILSASLSRLFLLFFWLSTSWTPCKSSSNRLTHRYNRLALSSSSFCHSCLWNFLSQLCVIILEQWWKCWRWQCMVWVELLRQTQINRRCEEA